MTNERERLIKEVGEWLNNPVCYMFELKNGMITPKDILDVVEPLIADFILADRRRVLEEVEKPLKEIRDNSPRSAWKESTQVSPLTKAIDEALAKIKELKG